VFQGYVARWEAIACSLGCYSCGCGTVRHMRMRLNLELALGNVLSSAKPFTSKTAVDRNHSPSSLMMVLISTGMSTGAGHGRDGFLIHNCQFVHERSIAAISNTPMAYIM